MQQLRGSFLRKGAGKEGKQQEGMQHALAAQAARQLPDKPDQTGMVHMPEPNPPYLAIFEWVCWVRGIKASYATT